MQYQITLFLLALQFLTRIPVPADLDYSDERLALSVRYYPLVGALVGAICGLVYLTLSPVLPHTLTIVLTMASGILITGAFHEDGLADCWDGIGGGMHKDHALEIMKDSRIGTYGACALMTVMAGKFAALNALPPAVIPAALIAAHCLSRLSSVLVIATSRYVRGEGKSKPVVAAMQADSLVIAVLSSLIIAALSGVFLPIQALIYGLIGLGAGHVAMRLMFERKLGGYTGDTLGAVQQMSEFGFLTAVVAAWA